jgi:hypothetical protein
MTKRDERFEASSYRGSEPQHRSKIEPVKRFARFAERSAYSARRAPCEPGPSAGERTSAFWTPLVGGARKLKRRADEDDGDYARKAHVHDHVAFVGRPGDGLLCERRQQDVHRFRRVYLVATRAEGRDPQVENDDAADQGHDRKRGAPHVPSPADGRLLSGRCSAASCRWLDGAVSPP